MRWSEELTLIELVTPTEATNANGFPNKPSEVLTDVYANKLSITQNEFYKGAMANMNPKYRFEVRSEEYDDQTMAEYEGNRYHVLRTFTGKSGEIMEIVLSSLPHGGANNG